MAALLLLPLAACAPQAPRFGGPSSPYAYGTPPVPLPAVRRERVGLLLPLSGGNRALGEAMLNAAQMALFDAGDAGVELLPRDTRGTPAGAAEAARAALSEGARALVGPLTGAETAAAAQAGARRFGLLAPADEFGRRLAAGMQARLQALALPAPVVVLYPPRGEVAAAAAEFAAQAGPERLDAVLLGGAGAAARAGAAALAAALPSRPQFLGHALWVGDASLGQEPALVDAWFPGPDPGARAGFESRYMSAFGERPPRLAGVAYDAAALAGRAARGGGAPVGEAMMGADGPIRLGPEGLAQRGLAIFAVDRSGEPRLVQPAPVPGLPGT